MSRWFGVFRALVVAAAMLVALPSLPASAAGPTVIAGLAGPLGLAVGDDGTVYVTESFAGRLTAIDKQGRVTVLVDAPGSELAGVDARGKGTAVYTQSFYEGPPGAEAPAVEAVLGRVQPNGKPKQMASLFTFEQDHNPDAGTTYGLKNANPACVDQVGAIGEPATYTGLIDSHPYAVAITSGGYVVADAAGNSIVKVSSSGAVSTLAVLPPIPQVIDQNAIDQVAGDGADLSACLGAAYLGEAVPTDIEIGPDGYYYVTTLPGFPENGGAGAVWRINPNTGAAKIVTSGLYGPVDLAVAPDGTIYVAELFGSRVTKIVAGRITGSRFVDTPGAIEIARDGTIYVTTGVFGPSGAVTILTP